MRTLSAAEVIFSKILQTLVDLMINQTKRKVSPPPLA